MRQLALFDQAYRSTSEVAGTNVVWKNVTGAPIGVEDGAITITNNNEVAYFSATFPELGNRNYYLRVPPGADLTQKQTLCVVLHPWIKVKGGDKAGEWMEGELRK